MQLLILCYTVVLSSIWLLPFYCCGISVPTSVLWVIMYLVTSNSFEFHLFIEIMPNLAFDMLKFMKKRARFLVIRVGNVNLNCFDPVKVPNHDLWNSLFANRYRNTSSQQSC